ncbi:Uncharacterised protein [Mycobacteroides abscessus subsp. abscessus]|nr:Uncharacterised protein [Mycobacteroides abscessus subsp. abscessus]
MRSNAAQVGVKICFEFVCEHIILPIIFCRRDFYRVNHLGAKSLQLFNRMVHHFKLVPAQIIKIHFTCNADPSGNAKSG